MATEEAETRDRSMARLAEILRENGVEVLGYKERECCHPPRLYFWSNKLPVKRMAEDNGYKVTSTQHSYDRVPGRAGVNNCRALIGRVCSWRGVSSGRRPN